MNKSECIKRSAFLTRRTDNCGFTIAKGSNISPSDLQKAGIEMRSFRFFPNSLDIVRRLLPDFAVIEIKDNVFSFDRLPF
ncbi:hypothetical protein L4D04_00565 [Photobacterium angustum]|uniref:hypothetical protein n=1 Tax=Photobacterium angustum TaxID=661 RepID=UPI003D12C7B5